MRTMAQGLANKSIEETRKPRNRKLGFNKEALRVSGRETGLFNKSSAVHRQKEKIRFLSTPYSEQNTGRFQT